MSKTKQDTSKKLPEGYNKLYQNWVKKGKPAKKKKKDE
jgi:hypothetical protein